MKKTILAMTIASLSSVALANNVTVFGTVEQEVVISNGDGVTDNTDIVSGDTGFGLSGSEDLGNGNSAFFHMEFDFDAEGYGNALVTDWIYMGLSGDFGTVTIGQIDNLTALQADKVIDVFETSLGIDTIQGSTPGNQISYATPVFSGFQGSVAMIMDGPAGEDNVDNVEYAVTYSNDMITAVGAYTDDQVTDADGYFVGARAAIGDFGVAGSFENVDDGVDDVDSWIVEGDYTFGNNTVTLGYQDTDDTGSTIALELLHSFSKRTSAYVAYQDFDADVANADTQLFGLGMRHDF